MNIPTISVCEVLDNFLRMWNCILNILGHQCHNNISVLYSSEVCDHLKPAPTTLPTVPPFRVRPVNAETSDHASAKSTTRLALAISRTDICYGHDWMVLSCKSEKRGDSDISSISPEDQRR